ncbi:RT0821/Lpp0805 family surface protein [Teichococcus oryzae]|nr:RT0821/Lpp0805 family surface protein [Pseudoroseomonas oryzae]
MEELRRPAITDSRIVEHGAGCPEACGPVEKDVMLSIRRMRCGVLALLFGLTAAMPAFGQWRDVRPYDNPMTQTDIDLQRESARSLLEAEPAPIGRSRDWQNPETGARGRVTLLRTSQRQGAPCRALRYVVVTRASANPVEMTFTLCRVGDDDWKIVG